MDWQTRDTKHQPHSVFPCINQNLFIKLSIFQNDFTYFQSILHKPQVFFSFGHQLHVWPTPLWAAPCTQQEIPDHCEHFHIHLIHAVPSRNNHQKPRKRSLLLLFSQFPHWFMQIILRAFLANLHNVHPAFLFLFTCVIFIFCLHRASVIHR